MASDVKITITGDASKLRSATDDAEGHLSKFTGKVEGMGGRMSMAIGSFVGNLGAMAASNIFQGIGSFASGALSEAEDAAKLGRVTDQLVKQTGASAWTSGDSIGRLAEKLSGVTAVDDELIQSGANVLLTFKNVQNQAGDGGAIFDRATKAGLDLSAVLGGDLEGANKMLGKALNDPVAGITAMTRAGVSFTDQQKDQIKAMAESGDLLGAQKLIMKEVEGQVGGAAEANATASDRIKVAWGNAQEALGTKLLPLIETVSKWFAEKLPDAIEVTFDWFGKLGTTVKNAAEWLGEHKPLLIGIATALTAMVVPAFAAWAVSAGAAAIATLVALAPFIAIGAAIGAVVAALIWAYQNWDFFKTAVDAVVNFMTDKVWPVIQDVAKWLVEVLGGAVTWIGDHWRAVWEPLSGIVERVWDSVVTKFQAAIQIITGIWNFFAGLFTGDWSRMWEGVKGVFGGAWNWIKDTLSLAWDGIVGLITGIGPRLATAGLEAGKALWNGIVNGMAGAVGFVGDIAQKVWSGIKGFINENFIDPIRSFKIPSAVPFLGGKAPFGGIPRLHTGGIFDAPGREGLALLERGEGVFTREQMSNLAPVSAGVQPTQTTVYAPVFNVPATKDMADYVHDVLEDLGRRRAPLTNFKRALA